ncbi:hypothetical protein IEO21_02002 [Rhodonia placenta]|uniref:Uncharacterized protein n=1 Tax=Rhodonia placenta TaxID=104341 RepID=A0A8H7P8D2_9APHY|nr:hypothetical protein IEO21_02002 [Postia placenta]
MARRAAKGKQRATEIDEDEMEAIEILTASEAEYSDEERGAIYGSGDDSDACGEEVSEGSEEGDAYEDEARSSPVPEVIEILSDDEEIEDTLPPLYSVDQRNGVDLDEEEYYDSGTDASDGDADSVEAEDGSEDERDFPPVETYSGKVDLPDPWAAPTAYAEDLYTGGDFTPATSSSVNPHILPMEVLNDTQAIEANFEHVHSELDLAFQSSGPEEITQTHYSERDVRESDLRTRLPPPSHLAPGGDDVGMFLTPEGATPETSHTPEAIHVPIPEFASADGEDERLSVRQDVPEKPEDVVVATDDGASRELQDLLSGGSIDDLYADLEPTQRLQEEENLDVEEHDFSHTGLGTQDQMNRPSARSPSIWRDESESPPPPKFSHHVDWNWPPAFNSGRMASRAGHLQSPHIGDGDVDEIIEISDDDEDVEPDEPADAMRDPTVHSLADDSVSGFVHNVATSPPHLYAEDAEDAEDDTAEVSESELPDLIEVDDLYANLDTSDSAIVAELPGLLIEPSVSLATDENIFAEFLVPPHDSEESNATLAMFTQSVSQLMGSATEQSELARTSDEAAGFVYMADSRTIKATEQRYDNIASKEYTVEAGQTVDTASKDRELSIVSVSGEAHPDLHDYEVEEPVTEGRRTEELQSRLPSPDEIVLGSEFSAITHAVVIEPDREANDDLNADNLSVAERTEEVDAISSRTDEVLHEV